MIKKSAHAKRPSKQNPRPSGRSAKPRSTKVKNVPFTQFHDMNSGGGKKEKWRHIFIEAPEAEACVIFYNRFGHNPSRVSCTCCGDDYSISEHASIEQATAYERGCAWVYVHKTTGKEISRDKGFISGKGTKRGYEGRYVERPSEDSWRHYVSLSDYLQSGEALVIRDREIKANERVGDVPEEGYVWR